MKKQTTSSVLKSILTSAILASALFINSANAAEKNSAKATPYEFKYVGKIQEQPIFQLDVVNLQKEEVYITLTDEAGNLLYTDKFNEANFSRKFQFDLCEGVGTRIKMTLVSKSIRQSQVFEINNIQTMVENVVVTKVS